MPFFKILFILVNQVYHFSHISTSLITSRQNYDCSDAVPISTSDFRRVLTTPSPILYRISAITEHSATRDLRFSHMCCLKLTLPQCDSVSNVVCCTWTVWSWTDRLLNASKCRELPNVTSTKHLIFRIRPKSEIKNCLSEFLELD